MYHADEQISNKLNTIFRHANIDPQEVTQILKDKFGLPHLGTYFIGIMTFQPVKLQLNDGTRIETMWYGNGTIATQFYLTVMDGDSSGGLKFYYEYQKSALAIRPLNAFIIT